VTDDLSILRMVGIKGRVPADAIADSLGSDVQSVQATLDTLEGKEFVKMTPMGYRITATGREKCAHLVAAEHQATDAAAVSELYDTFSIHNQDLKQIITDWQTRGSDGPNDHSDDEYDGRVLARLATLHERVTPLMDQIVEVAPRLAHYEARLRRAADAVAAGGMTYVSKPIIDSYHTVWFELHEDLIGLNGLTREEEAAAGRGA
jgi:hypothetical protein